MFMIFSGKYFDGKSSTGYPAKVTLGEKVLNIAYGGKGNQQVVEWLPEKIHTNDFSENHKVILKYGDFPFQYLEVEEPGFANSLKETYPGAKFHKSIYGLVFSAGFMGLFVMGAVFIGLLALSYFVILPALAERVAVSVPISWERELGDASYAQMVSAEQLDPENSNRIMHFFNAMNIDSRYDIEVVVVKDDMVNAFALPGGKIVVYEGILRKMNSYEELSALLSHEFSHVELKHSTKNIFRALSSYMLISILFGDASGITAIVIENANQIKQLGYSRSLEEEADRYGLKLMKERSIDPKGMQDMFKALEQEEGNIGVPEFLSTHPLTSERLNYVKKEIAKKDYSIEKNQELDSIWKEIKYNLE